ncbi:MAG TPA: NfeD family protein [Candidatus Eremiobacteraeota bacterium]|nr:MAG: hypothetical protein BWY64_02249 [bacterium ADurb.Bin363]HPZ09572.1 NfeD family protein [Candidatus Eremiobacteraeota bacterium]
MMKKFLLILIFVIFPLIVCAQETGKIEGKVLDMNFTPMEKVKVILENGIITTETDKEGRFVFENVSSGRHIVTYERKGWVFPESLVLIKPGTSTKPLEVSGDLKWWAYLAVYNIFFVIFLLTFIANFLLFLEYYVMPAPTKLIGPLGIILGIVAIIISFKATQTYLIISFILLIVLSLSLCIMKGQIYSKKMQQEHTKKKQELEIKESEKKDQFKDLLGKEGVAITDFSLIGKAEIDNKIYDAKSRKDFIKRGQKICVLEIEGNRLIVEKGSYSKYT